MKKAIDETKRRRIKQHEFNIAHGITPTSIKKAVADVMETGYQHKAFNAGNKVAEPMQQYQQMTEKQLAQEMKKLEQQMHEHAKNLEFEEAAAVRDKVQAINDQILGLI
ncbi:MAG: UvrB/UvrC motif-containing protein, partial [Gammaproteobacteria bacterium]|nr:UvrB/UvrC motif-containing protein [Gammaproteobacteria bacterium]